jgi:ribosomal protein S18 acetylase RimI-like enzyme
MISPWQVCRLSPDDLPAYRRLRLAALADHPESFGSSLEEELLFDDETFLKRMVPAPPSVALGGFADGELAGIGGLMVQPRLKQRHYGTIYGVYVAPAHRGIGLARGLLGALIAHGRAAELLFLTLSVTAGVDPARRLYLDLGFRPYGMLRRALKVGATLFDEELMVLDLDGSTLSEPAGSLIMET